VFFERRVVLLLLLLTLIAGKSENLSVKLVAFRCTIALCEQTARTNSSF